VLDEIEQRCQAQTDNKPPALVNHVAAVYEHFDLDELSAKIAQLVRPQDLTWKGSIEIIYQSIEGLRTAIPDHAGVWYFNGEYPTPGGYRVLDRSYLNWRRACDDRAYELPTASAQLLPIAESGIDT
jgi:amidophosphoribosyltransferase